MANELIELQLQGSTTVYKVNDARITTTPITNPTHILGSKNANLTSIAPITIANLASVLGVEADNARQYIIEKVQTVAIQGDFRWDKGSAIVEIYDHVNKRVYAKFAIGGNDKSLGEVIYRIENQTLSGSTYPYPLKVYYYGTTQSGRVTFAGISMTVRITCSTSISLSSNTDTTGMTEKTFS